ncbi:MAG TPA: hypothetical protein VE201_09900 [Nitrospirales bacterium]|nr:hypothetical protein [Nitrospirales bacterium]
MKSKVKKCLLSFSASLLSLLFVCVSFAGELVSISTILAHPDSYHLQKVTLKGKVLKVRALDPSERPNYLGRQIFCPGASTFMLEDETGSIEVEYLGVCEDPGVLGKKPTHVSDGDRVIVQAQVQAPSPIVGEGRTNIYGEERSTVFAVAREIRRIGD